MLTNIYSQQTKRFRAGVIARAARRGTAACRAIVCSSGLLLLSSCGGNGAVNPLLDPPVLPGDPSTSVSNTYAGTQSPGLWLLTLDDGQKAFSYVSAATASSKPVQGNFAVEDGIENFGSTSTGVSAGMAVELDGRSAALRPGDNTMSPVSTIDPSGCFAVSGRVRFIYAGLEAASSDGFTNGFQEAYGTLVISTSTDGKTWQIGDQRQYALPNFSAPTPGTLTSSSAPLEYTATCSTGKSGTTITADANPVFTTPPTFVFNSAGYFVEDFPAKQATDSFAFAGVEMATASLSAADITAGSYRGLVYEPGAPGVPTTQPMRLDPLTGTKSLTGGVYPNDDPTKPAGSEYTITLGGQDSALFGVFAKSTVTKSDPSGECQVAYDADLNNNPNLTPPVQPGFDVNGVPTCSTQGVAVVGKPEGKYIIYFTSIDGTTSQSSDGNAYTLQMYLYQQ